MKKLCFILFSIFLTACSELIDQPKNLVSKDEMSEIIAEFAINDQLNSYVPATSMENATRFVLKKKKIKASDFTESYKYYMATGDLDKILTNAQEIVVARDPAAEAYIQKKLKDNKNVPAFAR